MTPLDACQTLAGALHEGMHSDARRLSRRLEKVRDAARKGQDVTGSIAQLEAEVRHSVERRAKRTLERPQPTYHEELPISMRRADIAAALNAHQVIIVAGETGSGKTTQLPKICLEGGRGTAGWIGCTQPRRIAATSVATRVARELGSEVGTVVGYQVRFSGSIHPSAYIKFMTDGILLAETQTDRGLYAYDTLIIDEAHERSLNIDFLLGYLKRLLPRRPELKIILSSATLDTERFAAYFQGAPIIAVEGRTHPVEVYYRPLLEEDADLSEVIAEVVEDILTEPDGTGRQGDILVFLPGEREIREATQALTKRTLDRVLVLPLYARLSANEQSRVFQRGDRPRVVLATNVAETSLTIPGVRTVIDTGWARMNRYSPRSQVSRLRIEPISRASADQRKGRCGRVGPGVCIRLYAEADYIGRPAYTDPEIKRTSLAAVILRMKALGLGEPEEFPFIEPPHPRLINEGYKTLQELQALDTAQAITALGRQLARLPVDPRIGRMILAASSEGALQEVLTVASALAIQDPRERPLAQQEAADARHRRFHNARSDFVAWLNLWSFYTQAMGDNPSKNALRRLCHEHFLSYNRMQEWMDLRAQLAEVATELQLTINTTPASYEALHRALLTGLLSRIGMLQFQEEGKKHEEKPKQEAKSKEQKEKKKTYLGARGLSFMIFPGSGVFGKAPRWLVAGELLETTKLYARSVAEVEPAWLESIAQHLVRRTYSDPHWEKRPGRVIATEQVTLYGLPIVTQRRVDYGTIDPVEARTLFIREALVRCDYTTEAAFFANNRALVEEIEGIEHKSRRRDILVDEQTVHQFYDERIPAYVYDHRSLDRWRQEVERKTPQVLYLDRERLMQRLGPSMTAERFPDHLTVEGTPLALTYCFDPGAPNDGVTLEVPLAFLSRIQAYHHEYLVPGLLAEKLTHLLRSLPKSLRVQLMPIPEYVQAAYETFADPSQREGLPLYVAFSRFLHRLTGVGVVAGDFEGMELPNHLRMGFRILGEEGVLLAEDRDLGLLRGTLQAEADASFRKLAMSQYERASVTVWDFGDLPKRVELSGKSATLSAYPALVEEPEGRVALRLFETEANAAIAHPTGLRRLFALAVQGQIRALDRTLALGRSTVIAKPYQGRAVALKQELLCAVLDAAFLAEGEEIRDASRFQACLVAGRARLVPMAEQLIRLVTTIFVDHQKIAEEIRKDIPLHRASYEDLRSQMAGLVYPGFVAATPLVRLSHYPRYLKAALLRLDKMRDQPLRDRERLAEIAPWCARFQVIASPGSADPNLEALRWMLEEWRVSLFAQELKATMPVSAKRIEKAWEALRS